MSKFPRYGFTKSRFKSNIPHTKVNSGDLITIKFPNDIQRLLDSMSGKKYVVGGAPRDILYTGKTDWHDIDIATDQDVKLLMERLKQKGFHTSPTGLDFGVFTVNLPSGNVDIAQFRAETYNFNDRHPTVRRVKTIEEDLARRDATVNAIALESLGNGRFKVIDPHGGLKDLERNIIRAVGNPHERINEDPLRSLRYAGIAAKKGYEFEIDPDTAKAIKDNIDRLDIVSKERLSDELTKRFASAEPSVYFANLGKVGLLEYLFPEFAKAKDTVHDSRGSHHNESVHEHTKEVLERLPKDADARLKITAMLHDVGKPEKVQVEGDKTRFVGHDKAGEEIARKRLTNLRFSNADVSYMSELIGRHMQLNDASRNENPTKALAHLVLDMKEDYPRIDDLITLAESDQGKPLPKIRELVTKWKDTPRLIVGDDVNDVEPRLRGRLLTQMRYIQLTQGKDRTQLLKILGGEAHNLRKSEAQSSV